MASDDGLQDQQRAFCLRYLENGFNATLAYRDTHPNVKDDNVACAAASRALRSVSIRAFLNPRLEAAWRPYQMGGEQALARVAELAADDPDSRVRLSALKVILEQSGKLKSMPDSIDALAAALRDDILAHKDA